MEVKDEHNQEADLSICETKIAMSNAKGQAESSRTGSTAIMAATTKPLSNIPLTNSKKIKTCEINFRKHIYSSIYSIWPLVSP